MAEAEQGTERIITLTLTEEEAASVIEVLRFPMTSHGQSVVEADSVADRLAQLLGGATICVLPENHVGECTSEPKPGAVYKCYGEPRGTCSKIIEVAMA